MKNVTWDDVRLRNAELESREYFRIAGTRMSRIGRSTEDLTCPFCRQIVTVYPWSFTAIGKRCDCGALIGSRGVAWHWIARNAKEPSHG